MSVEQKVRDAATTLKAAIAEAITAGYRVQGISGLDAIAISETDAVKRAEPDRKPAGVSTRQSAAPKTSGDVSSL